MYSFICLYIGTNVSSNYENITASPCAWNTQSLKSNIILILILILWLLS
jgi:hypothetical protein